MDEDIRGAGRGRDEEKKKRPVQRRSEIRQR